MLILVQCNKSSLIFLLPVIKLPKPFRPLTIAWPILFTGFDGHAEFALLVAAFVVLVAARMELTVTDVTNTMPKDSVRVIPKILDTIFYYFVLLVIGPAKLIIFFVTLSVLIRLA